MIRLLPAMILLASLYPAKAFDVDKEIDWLFERTKRQIERADREAGRAARENAAKVLPDLSSFGTLLEEASPRPVVPHRHKRVIECVTLNAPDQLGSIITCD